MELALREERIIRVDCFIREPGFDGALIFTLTARRLWASFPRDIEPTANCLFGGSLGWDNDS